MKKILIVLLAVLAFMLSCSKEKENADMPVVGGGAVNEKEVLLSSDFKDNDTYVIVCKGLPAPGLNTVASHESARRAALLNAYHIAKKKFGEGFNPEKEGEIENFEFRDNIGYLTYVIKREGLKEMMDREK